ARSSSRSSWRRSWRPPARCRSRGEGPAEHHQRLGPGDLAGAAQEVDDPAQGGDVAYADTGERVGFARHREDGEPLRDAVADARDVVDEGGPAEAQLAERLERPPERRVV